MRIPGPLGDWAGLEAPAVLVATDYDGTLVEIEDRPELATPDRELLLILGRLTAAPGVEVLVLSGRSIWTLLDWLPVPGLHLVGAHGAEWRPAHERPQPLLAPAASAATMERVATALRRALGAIPGSFVEEKGPGVAAHHRGVAPADLPLWRRSFAKVARALPPELEVHSGRRVEEVRFRGVSKGRALREIQQRRGWEGHPVLALGDDLTDESVFAALGTRDRTFHVGDRPTCAGERIAGVREARAVLEDLAAERSRRANRHATH